LNQSSQRASERLAQASQKIEQSTKKIESASQKAASVARSSPKISIVKSVVDQVVHDEISADEARLILQSQVQASAQEAASILNDASSARQALKEAQALIAAAYAMKGSMAISQYLTIQNNPYAAEAAKQAYEAIEQVVLTLQEENASEDDIELMVENIVSIAVQEAQAKTVSQPVISIVKSEIASASKSIREAVKDAIEEKERELSGSALARRSARRRGRELVVSPSGIATMFQVYREKDEAKAEERKERELSGSALARRAARAAQREAVVSTVRVGDAFKAMRQAEKEEKQRQLEKFEEMVAAQRGGGYGGEFLSARQAKSQGADISQKPLVQSVPKSMESSKRQMYMESFRRIADEQQAAKELERQRQLARFEEMVGYVPRGGKGDMFASERQAKAAQFSAKAQQAVSLPKSLMSSEVPSSIAQKRERQVAEAAELLAKEKKNVRDAIAKAKRMLDKGEMVNGIVLLLKVLPADYTPADAVQMLGVTETDPEKAQEYFDFAVVLAEQAPDLATFIAKEREAVKMARQAPKEVGSLGALYQQMFLPPAPEIPEGLGAVSKKQAEAIRSAQLEGAKLALARKEVPKERGVSQRLDAAKQE